MTIGLLTVIIRTLAEVTTTFRTLPILRLRLGRRDATRKDLTYNMNKTYTRTKHMTDVRTDDDDEKKIYHLTPDTMLSPTWEDDNQRRDQV